MDSSESEICVGDKKQLVSLQDKGSVIIMIYDVYLQDTSVKMINFAITFRCYNLMSVYFK